MPPGKFHSIRDTTGSIRGVEKVTLGADRVTSDTWVDLNQNGVFEATDLVKSVTVEVVREI
jgi:hypothetical protein